MKPKIIILCIFLVAIPLCCIFYNATSLSVGQKPNTARRAPITHSLQRNQIPDLGSLEYINIIEKINEFSGPKAAMKRIILDFKKYGYLLDKGDHKKVIRLYNCTSSLISNIGAIDMEMHYFRNELNIVPQNLSEMISLNKSLPPDKRWKLLPVKGSLYHMQGNSGEFNLKFVSPDGFCEAVYNKQGILLNEFNDPINMGTFNYAAGMHEKDAHTKYDVEPYLKWGNSANSPQKDRNGIKFGAKNAYDQYLGNHRDVDDYRNRILSIFYNNAKQKGLSGSIPASVL